VCGTSARLAWRPPAGPVRGVPERGVWHLAPDSSSMTRHLVRQPLAPRRYLDRGSSPDAFLWRKMSRPFEASSLRGVWHLRPGEASDTSDSARRLTPPTRTPRARATSDPDTSDPDTSGPDTSGPDTSGPDTSGPDTSDPDTSVPDTSDRDTSVPRHLGPETPRAVSARLTGVLSSQMAPARRAGACRSRLTARRMRRTVSSRRVPGRRRWRVVLRRAPGPSKVA